MHQQIDNKQAFVATGNRRIDPDRPSIVFVHGAGQDHTIWVLPKRYFVRHGYNVLDVDLPGHGYSEGPGFNRIEPMADWVVRGMDAVGLKTAALIGHSMGSLIALDAAARYSDRASKLVMVGTSVPMPVGKPLLEAAAADDHDALDMLTLWGHSAAAHMGGSATPGIWMLGSGLRLFEKSKPGVVHADLTACNEYTVGIERASVVACPTLLILGDRDVMTPAKSAQDVAQTISDARTIVLRGSGHAMLSERPEQVLDALVEFL